MSAAIARYEEQVQSLKQRSASLRQRVEAEAREVQGTAVSAAVAYFFGGMEAEATRTNRPMPTVAGLDPALAWGVGLTVAGRVVDGRAGELLGDAGKSLVVIAAYRQGSRPSR